MTTAVEAVICGACRTGVARYRLARKFSDPVDLCPDCAVAAKRADRRADVTRLAEAPGAQVTITIPSLFAEDGGPMGAPKVDVIGAGGRVGAGHPETSKEAARVDVTGQRQRALDALAAARTHGLLAEEVADVIDVSANQAAARLGELWELGRAAVLRERGTCRVGACFEGEGRHRPHEPCPRHGAPLTRETSRGRRAAVWAAL